MRIVFAVVGVLCGIGGLVGVLAAATMFGQIAGLIVLLIAVLLIIASALLEAIEAQGARLAAALSSSRIQGK